MLVQLKKRIWRKVPKYWAASLHCLGKFPQKDILSNALECRTKDGAFNKKDRVGTRTHETLTTKHEAVGRQQIVLRRMYGVWRWKGSAFKRKDGVLRREDWASKRKD
jgi:hypothetical protein